MKIFSKVANFFGRRKSASQEALADNVSEQNEQVKAPSLASKVANFFSFSKKASAARAEVPSLVVQSEQEEVADLDNIDEQAFGTARKVDEKELAFSKLSEQDAKDLKNASSLEHALVGLAYKLKDSKRYEDYKNALELEFDCEVIANSTDKAEHKAYYYRGIAAVDNKDKKLVFASAGTETGTREGWWDDIIVDDLHILAKVPTPVLAGIGLAGLVAAPVAVPLAALVGTVYKSCTWVACKLGFADKVDAFENDFVFRNLDPVLAKIEGWFRGGALEDMVKKRSVASNSWSDMPRKTDSTLKFVEDVLDQYLKDNPGVSKEELKVAFTGHSLGAILSTLSALKAKSLGYNVVNVENYDNPGAQGVANSAVASGGPVELDSEGVEAVEKATLNHSGPKHPISSMAPQFGRVVHDPSAEKNLHFKSWLLYMLHNTEGHSLRCFGKDNYKPEPMGVAGHHDSDGRTRMLEKEIKHNSLALGLPPHLTAEQEVLEEIPSDQADEGDLIMVGKEGVALRTKRVCHKYELNSNGEERAVDLEFPDMAIYGDIPEAGEQMAAGA